MCILRDAEERFCGIGEDSNKLLRLYFMLNKFLTSSGASQHTKRTEHQNDFVVVHEELLNLSLLWQGNICI